MPTPNEDRFLGALLGFAIGDALGMPLAGQDRAAIAQRHGVVDHYLSGEDEGGAAAGEVTEDTEVVLAIVEVLTTSGGELDPDLIGPRLVHLTRGESRRWFPPATLAALDRAAVSFEFEVPVHDDGVVTADVAARGLPIGLLHSIGDFDPVAFDADVELVVRLTHGGPAAISAAAAVALAARLAARAEVGPEQWPGTIARELGGEMAERLEALQARLDAGERAADIVAEADGGDLAVAVVPLALAAAIAAERFEEAPIAAVAAGGATDVAGAIAGGIAGARFGSRGIPQPLVDDLGSRIYVSLAAPWFFKAARRRAGLTIDLRPRFGGPRPDMPPRI